MANPLPSAPIAQPSFNPPAFSPKLVQSARDSTRRHSLPLHFLPPSLWSANASSASLVESEEAARGEHSLAETTVANRISALRQLNGATRSKHRYAKSTGARNSTFNQPVIVRTYSGTPRPRPQRRDLIVKKENGYATVANDKMDTKLPPVEAFSFKGIMDEIRHGVSEDLERIAEICARSRYSLSNQYEVHMPPHGRGDPVLVGTGGNGGGPTLQAISSDDEQTRTVRRSGRRTKSMAYGTLETIMSSSRSSDEDKSRKKPAAAVAEEVRGRAKKQLESSVSKKDENNVEVETVQERPVRHVRSKSASFASMIIDNAQGYKQDAVASSGPSASLVSEPARPQTSTRDLETLPSFNGVNPLPLGNFRNSSSYQTTIDTDASISSTVRPNLQSMSSILGSLSSWWNRPIVPDDSFLQRARRGSYAEGSLRDLLRATHAEGKGKGIDRTG